MATLLVIETDHDFCAPMVEALRRAGHTVIVASTLHEALERLAGFVRPDLVLVEVAAPDVRGRPAMQALRGAAQAPVVVITSTAPQDVSRVLPFDAVLPKPFSIDAVNALLPRCCKL
jgi:DNA-binding response OmpR family regulator